MLAPVGCCRGAVDGEASAGAGVAVSGTFHLLSVCRRVEDELRLSSRLMLTRTLRKRRPLSTVLQKWMLRACTLPLIVCLVEPGFKARCVRLRWSATHVVYIELESEEGENGFSLDLFLPETPVDSSAACGHSHSFSGTRTPLGGS